MGSYYPDYRISLQKLQALSENIVSLRLAKDLPLLSPAGIQKIHCNLSEKGV